MTFIRSISGFRGTIGGPEGDNLTPPDIVRSTQGYALWILREFKPSKDRPRPAVVIGRDARPSGDMVQRLVTGTLMGLGIDVLDLGLSTTPTVEMAVVGEGAQGGIILTASHNPVQWNALKLLDAQGHFISAEAGAEVIRLSETRPEYAPVEALGTVEERRGWIDAHIQAILDLELVDREAVAAAGFKVAVDAVHSTGGIAVPALLRALGVKEVIELYCEPHGRFPPQSRTPTGAPHGLVRRGGRTRMPPRHHRGPGCRSAGLRLRGRQHVWRGIHPCRRGRPCARPHPGSGGEQPQQHPCAPRCRPTSWSDPHRKCSGGSQCGGRHARHRGHPRGEGNGGVIYPTLHAGRDALVGIALFLTQLAHGGTSVSALRATYPDYQMVKAKIDLDPAWDVDALLADFAQRHAALAPLTVDGVKLDLPEGWVHLRKSNTEPIVRVYAEADTESDAQALVKKYRDDLLTQG